MRKMKISKISLGKNIRVKTHYDVGYLCRFSFLAFQVCLGPLVVGHVIGFSSPALPDLKRQGAIRTASQEALFASLMNIGGIIGSVFVGGLLDRLGRRWCLFVSVLPALLGYIFIGASRGSVHALLFGRVLTGLTCGLNAAATSIYLVEISPTSFRGVLGAFNQLGITIGIFLSYLAGAFWSYSALAWLGCCLAAGLTLCTGLPSFPESPRFLMQRRDIQTAAKVLAYLRPSHYDVQDELRDISACSDDALLPMTAPPTAGSADLAGDPSAAGAASSSSDSAASAAAAGNRRSEASADVSLRELYTRPEFSRPLVVALGLMALQQLSGINVIMFYAQDILGKTGAVSSPALGACLIGATQVAFTILAACLMDKFGRRQLLLLASLIMMLAQLTLGIFFAANSTRGYVAVVSLALFIIGFSLGWGPVPMLVTAEIFPTRARSVANGLAICSSWLFSFLITETFPALQLHLGTGNIFFLFSAMCLAGLYFVWRYVPETKGKSLEDLELHFIGTRSSLRSL
ncbi:hypothetical protein BOX15_Mlig021729g1 [Macrostomum lignano]|uniref:Major facilitator superfamily (MFS) profile domain-containing protein n=1 Tax=Macrostomum lignano TaxID=282301 RepID=A0A267DQV2_9PLAT|nr:hypothetical protein BOX15_Mlig021729g1 [Macrostomum lignano]